MSLERAGSKDTLQPKSLYLEKVSEECVPSPFQEQKYAYTTCQDVPTAVHMHLCTACHLPNHLTKRRL